MGVIMFNGVTSSSLGLKVWSTPTYTFAEKEVEAVHIPGRNGDILYDKGTYKNTTRTYNVSLYDPDATYSEMSAKLTKWLHPATGGYFRLYDTYEGFTFPNPRSTNPETDYSNASNYTYYRLATYVAGGEVTNVHDKAIVFEITFDCKPQRFLVAGDSASASLTNNYGYTAKPLLKVTGSSGTVTCTHNGVTYSTFSITPGGVLTYIDCDTMDVYSGSSGSGYVNKNSAIAFSLGSFPTLEPGSNTITGSGVSVEVIPRWWVL